MKRQNELIGSALTVENRNRAARPAVKWLSGLSAALASVVGAVCPTCIPALGSLLASLGLGFAAKEQFLHPLLIVFLSVGIGSLTWATWRHRRWWILGVGLVGASWGPF